MQGWHVCVILKGLPRKTRSVSDYHVLFVFQRKGATECSTPGDSGEFRSYSFHMASLSIYKGSFIAHSSHEANIYIMATLLIKWLCSLKTCRCLALTEVPRANKVVW